MYDSLYDVVGISDCVASHIRMIVEWQTGNYYEELFVS
jgi:hypothetical protein